MQILYSGNAPAPTRVALIVPRWTEEHEVEPQGVPFRSFTLGAAFLAAGIDVVFFDQEHDLDRQDRFDEFVDSMRSAVAAFFWLNELYPSNQCHNSMRMATRLRSALPTLKLVLGGEFISICPPDFFDIDLPMDFVLRGYGEETALRLVDCLAGSAATPDVSDIPGLVWRDAAGVLRHQEATSRPKFKPQYLELYRRVDLRPYIQKGGVFGNDQPTLTLAPGRGCTKGCAFCAWSQHPSSILDARVTFDLLVHLRERYGVRQFHFGELDFFMSRQRALELATLIRDAGSDVVWFALGSPIDLVDLQDEDWDLLHAGGLRKVEMGSESASARVLELIGKKHKPQDIFEVSKKMLVRGIVPMNNFLFGFPGETRDDRQATLAMIEALARESPTGNHFTYRYYQPTWDTALGRTALASAPDRPRRLDAWLAERPYFIDERVRTLPWLPEADEREVKQLINHDLPLATSRLEMQSAWRQAVYQRLRARARSSVARGRTTPRVDRWLFERAIRSRLDQTYVR